VQLETVKTAANETFFDKLSFQFLFRKLASRQKTESLNPCMQASIKRGISAFFSAMRIAFT